MKPVRPAVWTHHSALHTLLLDIETISDLLFSQDVECHQGQTSQEDHSSDKDTDPDLRKWSPVRRYTFICWLHRLLYIYACDKERAVNRLSAWLRGGSWHESWKMEQDVFVHMHECVHVHVCVCVCVWTHTYIHTQHTSTYTSYHTHYEKVTSNKYGNG